MLNATETKTDTRSAVERFEQWEAVLASELPAFEFESKTYGTEYVTGHQATYYNGEESFTVHHFIDSLPGEPDIWYCELLAGTPRFANNNKAAAYTLSQIREIKAVLDAEGIDWKDFIRESRESDDFELDGYRFIRESAIDAIVVDQYENDPYALGCFSDWFIADHTNLFLGILQALQQAEKFEIIGQHLIDSGEARDLILEACRLDGYGHMMNSYDGGTNEDLLAPAGFYFWRV